MGEPRGRSEREHMSQSWEANEFQAATGTEGIAWAVQRHVDFTDCKTSLSHHGRQISESESEAQGTAKGESQKRDSEERATGLSRQGGPEKEVGGRCQAAIKPWFVRRFRPAQLGRGRLAALRQSSRGNERDGRSRL